MAKLSIQSRQGFTIVELLVVIVVIGILAAISVVSYSGITHKAVTASLQSDLANASQQLNMYQVTNGSYPTANNCPTPTSTEICLKASNGNSFTYTTTGTAFLLTANNTNNNTIGMVTNNSTPKIAETIDTTNQVNQTFNASSTGAIGSVQTWTVPYSGTYTIEAWGAQGGNSSSYTGGYGAYVKGDFFLIANDTLSIIVGQQGSVNGSRGGGGGGGTFVLTSSGMPLVIAGGGGGSGQYNLTSSTLPLNASGTGSGVAGGAGLIVTSGSQGGTGSGGVGGIGGVNGAGGADGATSNCNTNAQGFGGGGYNSSGATVPQSGYSYYNGLNGGTGTNITVGGFGGGGGGGIAGGGGGGGGYSGGGGGGSGNCSSGAPGGGSGSYNAGTNISGTAGSRVGHGLVTITK
jgi:prepilin-type N-terminal cleavage/methylation domain-containing protein